MRDLSCAYSFVFGFVTFFRFGQPSSGVLLFLFFLSLILVQLLFVLPSHVSNTAPVRKANLLWLQGHLGFEKRSVGSAGGAEQLRLGQTTTTLAALQMKHVADCEGSQEHLR